MSMTLSKTYQKSTLRKDIRDIRKGRKPESRLSRFNIDTEEVSRVGFYRLTSTSKFGQYCCR